jgi:hypothetical protein
MKEERGTEAKTRWELPGLFPVPGPCIGGHPRGRVKMAEDRTHAVYTVSDGTNAFVKKFPCWPYYRVPEIACKEALEFARAFSVQHGLEYNGYRRIGTGIIEMKVGSMTTVFNEDQLPKVTPLKWTVVQLKDGYHVRSIGGGGSKSMHRVILGDCKGVYVQHIDKNGLNNLTANLRVKTQSWNRGSQSQVDDDEEKETSKRPYRKDKLYYEKHPEWSSEESFEESEIAPNSTSSSGEDADHDRLQAHVWELENASPEPE